MYVRKYFSEKKKKDVESMVNYIKEGFKECICQNPSFRWMDKETQSAALDKINAMATDIGYPPELVNKTTIDTYYQGELVHDWIFKIAFQKIIKLIRQRLNNCMQNYIDCRFEYCRKEPF